MDADDSALLQRARSAAAERLVPLTEQAETGGRQVTHNHLPIKRFFFAARDMLKQGRACAEERDVERAYVLILRFTVFFLERLPEHKDFMSTDCCLNSEVVVCWPRKNSVFSFCICLIN